VTIQDLIFEALRLPESAIAYSVHRRLVELLPGRFVLETQDWEFGFSAYAKAGLCEVRTRPEVHPQARYSWDGEDEGISIEAVNAWFQVDWEGHALEVVRLTWQQGGCPTTAHWIVGESRAAAEAFFEGVCRWCSEVRGEVLVFAGGYWQKDEGLYRAIQGATFENLVLPGSVKWEIRDDVERFFESRAAYEQYGVPWKRGILFIGPPGNGKTHTVKALINSLGRPCLYVKSFKARHDTDHASIREVFDRARKTVPCMLVFEDLDSLLDDGNRSFFLNELDGFAANTGIETLATTNHPDRLDTAILNRPSRFDRKYHFELPGPDERREYLAMWNARLQPEMRLPDAALHRLAARTLDFSFAYLKELVMSSMMRWINSPGHMEPLMEAQVIALREQMRSAEAEPLAPADGVDGAGD
jgi:hypothetical protein